MFALEDEEHKKKKRKQDRSSFVQDDLRYELRVFCSKVDR